MLAVRASIISTECYFKFAFSTGLTITTLFAMEKHGKLMENQRNCSQKLLNETNE